MCDAIFLQRSFKKLKNRLKMAKKKHLAKNPQETSETPR